MIQLKQENSLLSYGVSARSYLKRCANRLREQDPASLFYAAFELRNCVEARQAEYLEHYNPQKNKKIRPFKLGENAKTLAAIRKGDAIGKFEFILTDKENYVGYHTPVPDRLKKICEQRLDPLRHAQLQYRNPEDTWWEEQRSILLEGYRLAWIACKGDIPMPPLWNPKTGETHPVVFEQTSENKNFLDLLIGSTGSAFSLRVSYLDARPDHWVPDL